MIQYYPHPNGRSLISEPDDLVVQSQGPIKSMQPQRQAQVHDRTDLYPQTLLNCDSVEFEAMLNHLYSLWKMI